MPLGLSISSQCSCFQSCFGSILQALGSQESCFLVLIDSIGASRTGANKSWGGKKWPVVFLPDPEITNFLLRPYCWKLMMFLSSYLFSWRIFSTEDYSSFPFPAIALHSSILFWGLTLHCQLEWPRSTLACRVGMPPTLWCIWQVHNRPPFSISTVSLDKPGDQALIACCTWTVCSA